MNKIIKFVKSCLFHILSRKPNIALKEQLMVMMKQNITSTKIVGPKTQFMLLISCEILKF